MSREADRRARRAVREQLARDVRPPGKRNNPLQDAAAILGEHYSDYLVLVLGDYGTRWLSSGRVAGQGLAREYLTTVDEVVREQVRKQDR